MSPELIFSLDSGSGTSRPTKSSDCYSLGMVIYETISGHPPFRGDRDITVLMKVLGGERPRRGVGFAEGLWKMLERCWVPQPSERPSVEDVLQCLDMCSDLSVPPPGMDVVMDDLGLDELDTLPDDRSSRLEFNGNNPSRSADEKGRPPASPSSSPSFFITGTPHFGNAENLHRGVPSVDFPHGVPSSLQPHAVSEMTISGEVLPAVPLSTARERVRSVPLSLLHPGVSNFPQPCFFEDPRTRTAATPLTEGARTLDYAGIDDFISNTLRPGGPSPMRPGTPQSASTSSPTRPTGGGSGKSQQQGPIQVSFMKNPKRKRLAKVASHLLSSSPFFSLNQYSRALRCLP